MMFGKAQKQGKSTEPVRLVVVDRTPLVIEGIAALCRRNSIELVGSANRLVELSEVIRKSNPHVALIEAALVFDDATRSDAVLRGGDATLVVLDEHVNDAHMREAQRIGAAGYCTKQQPFAELASVLRRIAGGETIFDAHAAHSKVRMTPGRRPSRRQFAPLFAQLTPRELEIAAHLARGLSVKQAAALLKLSPSTVDNHKGRIMKKLNVHKAAELTRLAIRAGLIAD